MRLNRLISFILLVILLSSIAFAQNPDKSWQQYATPEEAGFSSERLNKAKALYDSLDAVAFMVVYDGKVLFSWGDVERRFMCHSVRKSLLSALYGIYVADGLIDMDKTMADLNIDDKDPLSEEEKKARIRDLIKARSGVYHPAAYETAGMKARRPKRGSHARDTFWYYNNWDFNVLGKIFEQETKTDIFAAFKKRLAEPLQMEDFRLMDGYHHLEPENSIHPAYPFKLSGRDLARLGLLYLNKGKWNDEQIILDEWIKESSPSYSNAGNRGGYGYLWWISGDFKDVGMYSALGVGAQVIAVIPGANMVIVQRVNTYEGKRCPPNARLMRMILEAKVSEPKKDSKLIPLKNTSSYKRPELIKLKSELLNKYVKEYPFDQGKIVVEKVDNVLLIKSPNLGNYRLLPTSETVFVVEDLEQYAVFGFDDNNQPNTVTLQLSSKAAQLYSIIVSKDIETAVKKYYEIKKTGAVIEEYPINFLGYQLMGINKMEEAIEIFKLNVEAYPESFNVWDSLGEAYMKIDDYELAIKNYKKSLELNPQNKNAEIRIKRMKRKMERK